MNTKRLKRNLTAATTFFPTLVFAHGEEALSLVFVEFGLILLFVTLLILLKVTIKGKFFILTLYLLATYFTFKAIEGLPYNQNEAFIHIVMLAIPSAAFVLTYIIIKKIEKK